MRYVLICNPGSSSGRGRRRLGRYRRLLKARDADFSCAVTRSLSDAADLARRAAEGGCDAVVAVGGDGTINRVLNGLLRADRPARRCAMGVLYAGTSPDFCRFHGLPTDPPRAVGALLDGQARAIDVCRMVHVGVAGGGGACYFACSANLGLGAGIAGRANRYRAHLGDFLGTLLATVLTLSSARPLTLELRLDGRRRRLNNAINVTVGKNPHLASGLKLGVDVSADDGRMFVFALAGVSKLSLLFSLPKIYSGRIAADGRFDLDWARRVVVRPRGRLTAECDGDPAGACPVEITLLPRAVNVIGARP